MAERKRQVVVADPKAEERLFQALKQKARGRTELVRVTRADAVALTGMASEQADPALKALVSRYRSHVAVTEEGELIYQFDPSLERRDAVPLRQRLAALADLAWRGFKLAFKVWIAITLVVYVVAFVLMMLALVFARSSDDRDDRHGDGGGLFWLWFWLMPDWAPRHDPYGRYRRRLPERPKKRFYQSVFDFVFGPKGAPVDPKESDKRLIAFLRDHKGRVTATELVALTGLSLEAADEELTRLMVEYDGDVEVGEDGVLVYNFAHLLTSAESAGTWWSWVWDRGEPAPQLTGNTPGTNAVVGGFAGFNLLAALTIGPAFLQRAGLAGDPTASFLVTAFPLAFSTLFLGVPAARLGVEKRRARKRERRKVRRELLREVFAHPGQPFDPEALSALVAERTGQPLPEVRAQLERLLPELDGDVDTDAAGNVRYVFPRLAEEQRAIGHVRERAALPALGEVVFSSEEDAR